MHNPPWCMQGAETPSFPQDAYRLPHGPLEKGIPKHIQAARVRIRYFLTVESEEQYFVNYLMTHTHYHTILWRKETHNISGFESETGQYCFIFAGYGVSFCRIKISV